MEEKSEDGRVCKRLAFYNMCACRGCSRVWCVWSYSPQYNGMEVSRHGSRFNGNDKYQTTNDDAAELWKQNEKHL